ncbi:hypothetical protein PFZ55_52980 [Streptomyces sp. MS2A]|nr:hypothetical protein [Streptomyces sp. MS2A]
MARIGGRSTVAAWTFGVLCVGVVAGLVVLAAPLMPVIGAYVTDTVRALLG